MPIFEVTTHSVFENKYYVEAETGAEASQLVENDTNGDIDFMQKHLQEKSVVVKQTEMLYENWYKNCHFDGYF